MAAPADPTASRAFDVPNVFVVPPEEDDVPRWCCFDAALPIDQRIQPPDENNQDNPVFDPTSPYDGDITPMDVALARRGMESRSITETLMSRDYNIDHAALDSDSDMEWDSENDYQPHSRSPGPDSPRRPASDAGNDSDVIEVVKVSRSRRDMGDIEYRAPASQGVHRTGTFKARAAKVFRSFTGTFRSSKPKTQDLPQRPSSSMSFQQEPKQTLPRSGTKMSRRFSQMFNPGTAPTPAPPATLSSRTSISSTDVTPQSVSEPALPSRSTSSSVGRSSISNETARRSSIYEESIPPDSLSRSPSPDPLTNGRSTKRFSKLNLQKMFSFSPSHANLEDESQPTEHPTESSGRSTPPVLKRKSSSLPSTSGSSESSGPQTPTTDEGPVRLVTKRSTIVYEEDGQSPRLDFGTFDSMGFGDLPLSLSTSSSQADSMVPPSAGTFASSRFSSGTPSSFGTSTPRKPGLEDDGGGDISFEMRLDSLHFDDLSFDADGFRVD